MDSKFEKLYNMFMEEVKSSKKTVIKEAVASIEDYKQFIRMCADIVKKAGEAGKQAFIDDGVNEDTSCTMDQDLQNYNITLEQWENAVKYGWIVDSLPFAIDYTYDDCFEKVMTPEEQEQIEEFVHGDDHQFTNYFYEKFLTGDATDLEFCKQLSEELGVTDPNKRALMIDEYFEGDGMAEESAKKPVSKKRIIKEHRAHKPSRRRVIKESKLHFVKYSEQLADQWFKKVKENKKVIPLVLQKNKSNVEGMAKLYNTVEDIDEWMDDSECEMSTNEWWEKLGFYVDPYLLQDTTGMPEFDDDCWYDRADDYSYQVKNYIEEHILPEYTKEQMKKFAEITGYPYDDMDYESKKVDRRRQVIKESVRRHARRHTKKVIKESAKLMRKHHVIKESTKRALKKLTGRVIKEETETDEPDYSLPEDDPCHWWGKKDVAAVKAAMAKAGVECPENKIAGVLAQCCGDLYWNGFREPEQLDGYRKEWWDEMIAAAPEHFTNADYPEF